MKKKLFVDSRDTRQAKYHFYFLSLSLRQFLSILSDIQNEKKENRRRKKTRGSHVLRKKEVPDGGKPLRGVQLLVAQSGNTREKKEQGLV